MRLCTSLGTVLTTGTHGERQVLTPLPSFPRSNRTINSVVLLCNGISFAIQIVIFLILGSYADFGTFRPNILIVLSLVAWGIGFGWLGVHTPDQWQTGLGTTLIGGSLVVRHELTLLPINLQACTL